VIKNSFLFIFLLGCTEYKVPIQTDNHPASSDALTSQIELSPILDINQSDNKSDSIGVEETYVQIHS